MAHIHTGPSQHDSTSSAWIVRLDSDIPRLYLHLHKKLGVWMQPGGHVELNETPWQAILHEIIEESGYNLDQLKILQPHNRLRHISDAAMHPVPVCENTHAFPAISHFHTDRAYAFATHEEPLNTPGDDESQDSRWVTAAELAAIPESETISNVREIGLYVFKEIVPRWEKVPLSDFQA